MIDGAGTHNFTYDNLDRLTAATHPNQTNESYTLDDVGNRTASHQGSSYSYQAFNRLVTANGATFGYDTNGDLTSKTDASGTWTYMWDYENRLKQASKSVGVTVTYSFDALARRVQRTSSASGTTRFVYDGADVLRDLDGTNATVTDYLNGPGIDNKLRQTSSGTASYFLNDHLGTTRALADASGSVTSSLSYDSFGNLSSGSQPARYTFTGRESDFDSSLVYYRARWYDAAQGRFITEDPIGFKGGMNFYAYVDNNPLRYLDPFGLQKVKGDLTDLCDTDDCQLLRRDILRLEISLHIRDYVERWEYGGKLDKRHEDRIKDEDAKLKECYARYFAKCKNCTPPAVKPLRKPNYETKDEARMREKAQYHQNVAIGVAAAGSLALAGVAVLGAAGALVVLVF